MLLRSREPQTSTAAFPNSSRSPSQHMLLPCQQSARGSQMLIQRISCMCLLSEWIDLFWVEIPKYSCVCQPIPLPSAGSAAMCPTHVVDAFCSSSRLDGSNSLTTTSPRVLIPWLHLGHCPVFQMTHHWLHVLLSL